MSKHTLNGTKKKVIKTSGFRLRASNSKGRKILKARQKKGRWQIALSYKKNY